MDNSLIFVLPDREKEEAEGGQGLSLLGLPGDLLQGKGLGVASGQRSRRVEPVGSQGNWQP